MLDCEPDCGFRVNVQLLQDQKSNIYCTFIKLQEYFLIFACQKQHSVQNIKDDSIFYHSCDITKPFPGLTGPVGSIIYADLYGSKGKQT